MPVDGAVCLGISAFAAVNDLTCGKVSNRLVFPAFFLGLIWNLSEQGLAGFMGAAMGGLLPLILFPTYAMRLFGAGDIKLLMALGAWLGYESSARLILLSILSGGLMAIVVMVLYKNCIYRFKRLWVYLKACVIAERLLPYQDFSRMEQGAAVPFALAVFGALVWFMLSSNRIIPQII